MNAQRTLTFALTAALIATAGCDDGGGSQTDDTQTDDTTQTTAPDDAVAVDQDAASTGVAVSELIAVENPGNSLSFYVSWTTDSPVVTSLSVDCGPEYQRQFDGESPQTGHEVFAMGFWAGASCTFTALPDVETQGETTVTVDDVGALPDALEPLVPNVANVERMQPGWTLFSLARATQRTEFWVVAIDELGRYRWMYSPGDGKSGAGSEITLVPDGILLGNAFEQIISWEGEKLWELDENAHHDIRLSPWNDGHVLYLGVNPRGCGDIAEHGAFEFDMETGENVWDWSICEHYTGRVEYRNWSHLNTLEPVPDERAMLISSRNQDMVFKVDRDTGEVEWKLGLEGDFEMDEGTHFLRQHAPEVQPDGTILILDNGLAPGEAFDLEGWGPEMAREYTRAIQYELTFMPDGTPDRANVVWEYADESIFAVNRSEADRLSNGNTLIHYVWVQPDETVILREVDEAGEVVWDIETSGDRSSYRSERVDPYWGHVVSR